VSSLRLVEEVAGAVERAEVLCREEAEHVLEEEAAGDRAERVVLVVVRRAPLGHRSVRRLDQRRLHGTSRRSVGSSADLFGLGGERGLEGGDLGAQCLGLRL